MALLPNGHGFSSDTLEEITDTEPLIENDPVPRQCCSARLNLAAMMFLGFSVVYGLRVNLSVAMVAMVNSTEPAPAPNHTAHPACPLPAPPMDNSSQRRSNLMGGVLGTAILTLLTPLAAEMGSYWLFGLRALEGFGEGVTFPAMMAMWARWAPPMERSRLMTLSGAGANFGAFVALPLTGYICQTLGWPAVFYLCGGIGCLWSLFWFMLVSDDPRTHRRISKEERDYIISSIGSQGTGHGWSVPLLPMLLSVPLWGIIISQMCANWSYYTLLTSLPTYMNTVLHFDLKSNAFLSGLPYLGGWFFSLLSGVAADCLIERRLLSVTAVRKTFTVTGLLLPSAFLVAVGYAGCSAVMVVTFLTLSATLGGTSAAGVFINQIDIAPRYAGFLLGITNTFATIPGVVAPIVTGYLTEDHSLAGWRMVFCISAGISAGGALVFMLLGSGKLQPWAMTEEERAEADRQGERAEADRQGERAVIS